MSKKQTELTFHTYGLRALLRLLIKESAAIGWVPVEYQDGWSARPVLLRKNKCAINVCLLSEAPHLWLFFTNKKLPGARTWVKIVFQNEDSSIFSDWSVSPEWTALIESLKLT